MNKRGAAHIEVVLAFIIFTGSLFFLFYYLEPFSALRPNLINERLTLEFLSGKLETEVNIIDFVIYPDEINDLANPTPPALPLITNKDNLKITLEIPLDPIDTNYLWVNKTSFGQLISAELVHAESPMKVEIDWDRSRNGKEETYRIYHALIDSSEPDSPDFPSGSTDLKEVYRITSVSKDHYLSYKSASDLTSSPYINIKNALGIGSINSINGYFRLSFPDSNTDLTPLSTQSKAPTPNADTPIYSASKNLIVYDKGKLYPAKLEVIIW